MPEPDHYANITFEGAALMAHLVGPSLGEHEGKVIENMIRERLESVAAPVRHVVLDFRDVSYINSAALGACVVVRGHATAHGAEAVLLHMNKDIADVVKICRFDRLFKIAADEKKLAKLLG